MKIISKIYKDPTEICYADSMNIYKKKYNDLNINILYKLIETFAIHNWSKEENDLFDRFCKMLRHLTESQQELILELTSHFLRLGQNRYLYHLRDTLSQIEPEDYETITQIYVLPLLQPADFGKSKSATFVAYEFQSLDITSHVVFQGRKCSIVDKPERLPNNINRKPCKVFLVDDFIGTGETAENALNHLINEVGIDKSKIVVVCIVAQKEGFLRISSIGVKVYCSIIRQRGISDKYNSPIREEYQKTMQLIEDFLSIDDGLRFGYKGSEALVSLVRTPNNTFPVFWSEPHLKNGGKFVAPFPRLNN